MRIEDVLEHIDEKSLVELTQEMVRIQTVNPPGNEVVLAEILQRRMNDLGLDARVLPFEGTRANIVCIIPGQSRHSSLVFSGHLDTVPFGTEEWKHDPLSGDIAEGKIFGRGASDMKGGVAAMVMAAHAIHKSGIPLKGDLILAFTAGEEVDSAGAEELLRNGIFLGAGGLVISEPTNLDICVAEKGGLWLEATVKGKSAHASTPQHGKNAILPMAEFIMCLQKMLHVYLHHPLLGGQSMNVGTIQGGFKTNVVPDFCKATIDFRTVPGQDHRGIYEMVKSLLSEIGARHHVDCDLKIINDRKPVDTSPGDPFVKLFRESSTEVLGYQPQIRGASYFTDGAVLVPAIKAPLVICGPGDAACAHQTDEWVKIENLRLAARIYALMAVRVLG